MPAETRKESPDKISLQAGDMELLKSVNFRGGRVILRKGDILYSQDDMAISFYLVLSGAVELMYVGGFKGEEIKIFEKNSFFGFEDIFNKNRRDANCVALMDTVLIEIFFRPDTKLPDRSFKEQSYVEILNSGVVKTETYKGPITEVIKESEVKGMKVISIFLQRCNFLQAAKFKIYIFDVIEFKSDNILIDLQHCKIIDSTFLGVLVAAQRRVKEKGGKLKLVCNKEIYSWLFLVTRMDKVFDIYTNMESAFYNKK
jgi:anti-sigma B factor antagonist